MRLTVKNLGVISKAEIDLSKDLILLTGENNTGKTYLAYVVYGLYNRIWHKEGSFIPPIRTETPGKYSVDLDKIYFGSNYLNEFKKNFLEQKLNKGLSKLFSTDSGIFSNSEIKVELDGINRDRLKCLEIINRPSYIHFEGDHSSVNKKKDSYIVEFETSEIDDLDTIVYYELMDITISLLLKAVDLIPAERQGINLFHKELSLIKNKTFDSLLTNGKSQELLSFFNTRFNKYPKPIKDALDTAQNLDAIQKQKSEYAYLADEMEKSLIGGKVQMNEDGDIQFKPDGSSKTLEIHLASSSVKSLASLSIYLRHIAKKGDFIIIDEPEANLHPNNQIKIARFLARLVNEGFKVMVSTHSDYIVRELNSLIMLGSGIKTEPATTNKLMKRYKYHENTLLNHEQVGVHLFRVEKEVETVKVNAEGFEIATIDETVQILNQSSQDIYYQLFD